MHPALLAAAGASGAAGLVTAAYWAWRTRLGRPPSDLPSVLAYHKIGTPELGGTWCTKAQFAAQLTMIRSRGFRAIDARTLEARLQPFQPGDAVTSGSPPFQPDDAVASGSPLSRPDDAVASGSPFQPGDRVGPRSPQSQLADSPPASGADPTLSRREFLVTFDDAFESFATHAWPILSARHIPALVFVIVGYVGRRAAWDLPLPGRRVMHLSWSALRDLVAEGVEIGSHTLSHRDLRRLPASELHDELVGSRARLEDALGVRVRSLSYPFGRCDPRTRAAARAAGYRLGFAMCPPGPNHRVDPFAIRRWGVYVTDSPHMVLDKLDASRKGFWVQDLATRGISACAALPAARLRLAGRA